jgi:hypothetical protein
VCLDSREHGGAANGGGDGGKGAGLQQTSSGDGQNALFLWSVAPD